MDIRCNGWNERLHCKRDLFRLHLVLRPPAIQAGKHRLQDNNSRGLELHL